MSNDWMQQEAQRQAAESGDPSAMTSSWQRPAPYRSERRASTRKILLGVAVAIAVLVAVVVGFML